MDTGMNEFLERQRLIEEQRRISVSNQIMQLKQVLSRDSQRYTVQFEQQMKQDTNPLQLMIDSAVYICKNCEQKQEKLNKLHSVVCGVDLKPSIVRLKYEADENRKRNKAAIVGKRKLMIERANETLQENPKVCQVNSILKNIENAKVQMKILDEIDRKENAQIQKDQEKDQNDAAHEDKMVYDLNESIRYTEQELQNVECERFNLHSGDESEPNSQKSSIEQNVAVIGPEVSAKVQKEDEDAFISPVKVVQMDYTMPQNLQKDHPKSHITKPTPASTIESNDARNNRAQASVPGRIGSNRRLSVATNMMINAPYVPKQSTVGNLYTGPHTSLAAKNDPKLHCETPKLPIADKEAKRDENDFFNRQNLQNDYTNSHVTKPTPAQQSAATIGSNNVQSNRAQGSDLSNNRRASGAFNTVANVPSTAKQLTINSQYLGAQNLSTVTNDPRLCLEPPTVGKQDDKMSVSSNTIDYSTRQNLQNDQTKSHVTKPTPAKQIPSTVGTSNVQNNRAQGSNSGSNYRSSGASNMDYTMPQNLQMNREKSHVTKPTPASTIVSNDERNNRAQASDTGSNRRPSVATNLVTNAPPYMAKQSAVDSQYSGAQKFMSGINEPSTRYGMVPPSFDKEQGNWSSSSNANDMVANRSTRQSSNDFSGMANVAAPKPKEPSSASIAPQSMASAPISGNQFAEPNLPQPYGQKRKSESNQPGPTKKPHVEAAGFNPDDWFGSGDTFLGSGQSAEDKTNSSFMGSFDDALATSSFKFDISDGSKKGDKNEKANDDDFSFGRGGGIDFAAFDTDNVSGNLANNVVQDDFDGNFGFE